MGRLGGEAGERGSGRPAARSLRALRHRDVCWSGPASCPHPQDFPGSSSPWTPAAGYTQPGLLAFTPLPLSKPCVVSLVMTVYCGVRFLTAVCLLSKTDAPVGSTVGCSSRLLNERGWHSGQIAHCPLHSGFCKVRGFLKCGFQREILWVTWTASCLSRVFIS